MSTSAPIWADPRYASFFRRAEATIDRARRLQHQPWLGEPEARFDRMVLEICCAESETLAALAH
jgi:hypothetical protein